MTNAINQRWERNSTSPPSGRQNLAQGEASAASETVGSCFLKNLARFSGRKTFLSPAKAGSQNHCNAHPGLGFACPGLNSAVRSADSLSCTSTKFYPLCLLVLLVFAFTFAGCSRHSGGIGSGSGGFPPSSATPALVQVSSSAEVVRVTADALRTAPGGSAEALVKLAITSGYHVNANPATYPYLIATEIKAGNVEGISTGLPTYPVAAKKKFEFADEPLAVYEGDIEVKLPLKIDASLTSGPRSLPVTVRVQACDTEKCFPPATINANIPIEVK